MARWAPGTRDRLRTAALELFDERGFAATTVRDIVTRAGVTRRTFFRHFRDKREAFFGGDEIPALATRVLAEAPPGTDPMTLIRTGLQALTTNRFEPRRDAMRSARGIIDAEPALRERDLQRQADLREAIRSGFARRGLDPLTARVLGGMTVELLQTALETWLDDDSGGSLAAHLEAAEAVLREVLAE